MKNTLLIFFVLCCTVLRAEESDYFKEILKRQTITSCEFNIVLNSPEENAENLYWAANRITVKDNYRIAAGQGSNIRMKAGKMILLKPGTNILKGNHYLARIETCESKCVIADAGAIPKGISPNGDGANDVFDLSFLCPHSLTVFNRYGVAVYESENYSNEWHGQSGEHNLPTGTYFYAIAFATGEKLTGWVYLQR